MRLAVHKFLFACPEAFHFCMIMTHNRDLKQRRRRRQRKLDLKNKIRVFEYYKSAFSWVSSECSPAETDFSHLQPYFTDPTDGVTAMISNQKLSNSIAHVFTRTILARKSQKSPEIQ